MTQLCLLPISIDKGIFQKYSASDADGNAILDTDGKVVLADYEYANVHLLIGYTPYGKGIIIENLSVWLAPSVQIKLRVQDASGLWFDAPGGITYRIEDAPGFRLLANHKPLLFTRRLLANSDEKARISTYYNYVCNEIGFFALANFSVAEVRFLQDLIKSEQEKINDPGLISKV